MKRLLVVTDFSASSDRAIDFAILLAEKNKAEILFIHAYDFPNADPLDPAYLHGSSYLEPVDLEEDLRNAIDRQLSQYCELAKHRSNGKIQCDFLSASGISIEELIASLENLENSVVVMGSRGHSQSDELLMGSHAVRMVEHSPVPVIIVPRDAEVSELKEVVYASELKEQDIEPLKTLTEWIRPFDAQLHVLHIEKKIDREDVDVLEGYQEIVRDHIDYPNMVFTLMSGDSVLDEINEYVGDNHANMLAMTTERKKGLFHRSLSKRMIFHTNVPLMVFHA